MTSIAVFALGALKAAAFVALLLLARGGVWLVNMLLVAPLTDPLRKLPGPDASPFQNHFREVMDPNTTPETHAEYTKVYGRTFRFHGFGRHDYRLMSLDLCAVSHILNSPVFEKPWQTRSILSKLLGRGVFAMEGEEHKRQRKIISPAFSTNAVNVMSPIFLQKAEELLERWDITIDANSPKAGQDAIDAESTVIDVAHWLSRATFDVIGLAGFDYAFRALENERERVYRAYRDMFTVQDKGPGFLGILRLYFPILDWIYPDEGTRITRASLKIIGEEGQKVIQSKKEAILAEKASAEAITEKDILSLLINSNLSSDPSKRLSDTELLDQLNTFLFAGSDSTALALVWTLHHLSLQPELQTRLRAELLFAHPTPRPLTPPPTPTHSDSPHLAAHIDALPLLDAVVREALRLAPPVHGTIRVATQDTAVPLAHPLLLRDGTLVHAVPVRRGSYVHIPIEGLNTSADIWGPDAMVFNPDRWMAGSAPPGLGLAGLMTFSLGPHACPGWKFTVLEMKCFLSVLVPHFVFKPADSIKKFNAILTRPFLEDRFELGARLDLRVGRYVQ